MVINKNINLVTDRYNKDIVLFIWRLSGNTRTFQKVMFSTRPWAVQNLNVR